MHAPDAVTVVLLSSAIVVAIALWSAFRRRNLQKGFISERDLATYETLHTAALAGRYLGDGLTEAGATRALPHLRTLLGSPAMAITGRHEVLAWDGVGDHHRETVRDTALKQLDHGKVAVRRDLTCGDPDCLVRSAVIAPIIVRDNEVGLLVTMQQEPSAGLVRACEEVAGWVASQVDLADLSIDRTRAMEAELRALRAQISPHFIYNSLGAIASFVRTDPDRARELLLEFADFTRYALRQGGAFTTLADELRNVERYLVLEQARFGARLQLRMKVAPEVLPVEVPYLAIQPLVENAVRHGLAPKAGVGHIDLVARDLGTEAEISVDDDGIGADPDHIRQVLDGVARSDSLGLGNVDARLRQTYGDHGGLVVDTAPGAGMKVSFRVPKFAPRP